MKNKKTRFYATICIGLVFVFSIIPLLVLAQYNHGWADDYSYGFRAYSVWKQTHSVRQIILAAVEQAKSSYFDWQGTYAFERQDGELSCGYDGWSGVRACTEVIRQGYYQHLLCCRSCFRHVSKH